MNIDMSVPAYAVLGHDGVLTLQRGITEEEQENALCVVCQIEIPVYISTKLVEDRFRDRVNAVVTRDPIRPKSMIHWFKNMHYCTSIDIRLADLSRCAHDMAGMISGCLSLESLLYDESGEKDVLDRLEREINKLAREQEKYNRRLFLADARLIGSVSGTINGVFNSF